MKKEKIEAIQSKLIDVEEKYSALFKNTSDGICILSSHGEILEVNEPFCCMSGYSPDECTNLTMQSFESAEAPYGTSWYLTMAIGEGGKQRFEKRYRHKDGSYYNVEITLFMLRRNDNKIIAFIRSVSKLKKRTEMKLLESECRFRIASSSAQLGVFEMDIKNDITYWENEHLYRIFGRSIQMGSVNLQTFLSEVIIPEDKDAFQRALAYSMRPGNSFNFICRIQRYSDHFIRWIKFSSQFITKADDETLFLTGIIEDITERKISELQFQKRHAETVLINRLLHLFMEEHDESRFAKVLETVLQQTGSKIGLFGYFTEQRFLDCIIVRIRGSNKAEVAHFKFTPEQCDSMWNLESVPTTSYFVNKPFPVPPGHPQIDGLLITPVCFQGQMIGLLNQSNGDKGYTSDDCELCTNIADKIAPVVYAFIQKKIRDSEHETAVREQHRALCRFELLASVAGELLQARDPLNVVKTLCTRVMVHLGCDLFLIYLIDEHEKCLVLNEFSGISESQSASICKLNTGESICGSVVQCKSEIVLQDIDEAVYHDNGFVKALGMKGFVCYPIFETSGCVIGTLSFGTRMCKAFNDDDLTIIKNVTDQLSVALIRMRSEQVLLKYRDELEKLVEQRTVELRKSQEQLIRAQKMEALGLLAGGIAHDFNNIIQVISGFAYRALKITDTNDPIFTNITRIKDASLSAAALTHRLLAFSRKQILQMQIVQLNNLIMNLEPVIKHTLGDNINFHCELDPGLDNVKTDPVQMQQVIMNIALNARSAMPCGGVVTLQTKNVSLSKEHPYSMDPVPAGQYVMLVISDIGCGMKKEIVERIFEPFFTTRPFGTGSGLGLSTAYGIIRQSEGVIRVYSQEGCGTTFKIYLPRTLELPQLEKSEHFGGFSNNYGETILVVEDNHTARELITLELKDLGYHVLEAGDSMQALSISRHYKGLINLLLTDIVLQGTNGWEISKILTHERPGMPTLYISGYDQDQIIKEGKLIAGAQFLAKPFLPEQLATSVRDVLNACKNITCKSLAVADGKDIDENIPVKKVLIIDDLPGVADAIALVLSRSELDIRTAEDGQSALLIAAGFKPDIVILDIRLPDMDGWELARHLKNSDEYPAPLIIVASGYYIDDRANKDLFDAYIAKPVDFKQLENMIMGDRIVSH